MDNKGHAIVQNNDQGGAPLANLGWIRHYSVIYYHAACVERPEGPRGHRSTDDELGNDMLDKVRTMRQSVRKCPFLNDNLIELVVLCGN